jgi:hypothetical protein
MMVTFWCLLSNRSSSCSHISNMFSTSISINSHETTLSVLAKRYVLYSDAYGATIKSTNLYTTIGLKETSKFRLQKRSRLRSPSNHIQAGTCSQEIRQGVL